MPIVCGWLALPLERDFPVQLAEEFPTADAIILLGGGMGGSTNYPYADMGPGADRAWHAARLWKAGKAPIIIPSNEGAELADVKLLVDLGVPREAVVLETRAVNTEENVKFVREILTRIPQQKAVREADALAGVRHGGTETRNIQEGREEGKTLCASDPLSLCFKNKRILLVTSACHMRRSLYLFKKYAPEIECIPAATDYQALPWKNEPFKWRSLLPNIGAFAHCNDFIHEYIGYWGYRVFR
jgi:uncharacterized SAM-binding protein YcdF (DUF218 family)